MKKVFKYSFVIAALSTLFLACNDDDMVPTNTAPTISDQTFSIVEDANIGTSVGTVAASDADNDPLTFSIIAGNSEGVFSIESTSGEILLSETLDFETTSSYSLTVQAADNESNATAIITINVTDAIDPTVTFPMGLFAPILDGTLIGADYWSDQPEILSAGMGFCDIVGVTGDALTQELVEQAGGTWLSDIGCNPDDIGLFTATSLQSQVGVIYILQTPYGELKDGAIGLDGLPIVFSWPVVTSTISLTDFQFTLNTGEIVTPLAASSAPNLENNERNCVVVFAEFGNKLPSNHPDSRFPVKCEIVADETPLMLVGPNNQMVSAVGLTWETTTSPYDDNNGPRLVGAKLNYVGNQSVGEGISNPIFNNNWTAFPNDEFALYGGGDFRLRMLTTGGFSPDGVRGVLPTDYEKFFRIHATGTDGSTVLLEEVGVDYQVMGGTLRVVGLSDLGRVEGNGIEYGDCYTEDRDNYIDIILVGDDEAARNITFLEIPSLAGGYSAFYNPGGPGTTPFSGEAYSEPGPPDLEPVIIALDNPMRVSN